MLSRYQYSMIMALLAWSASTQAEITLCTEITPPATITQPGIYCLLKDHVVNNASPAVSIRANNVVFDLNGHRIGGGNGNYTVGSAKNVGIQIKDSLNTTVRNGTIRGFSTGIELSGFTGNQGHLVEDMLIDGAAEFGIFSITDNSIFRSNRISGSRQAESLNTQARGIYAIGSGVTIDSNNIRDFFASNDVSGLFVSGSSNVVTNNLIHSLRSSHGLTVGIQASSEGIVSNNKVLALEGGTVFGINAGDALTKIIGNVVSVIGYDYYGGNQVPGTNH